MAATQPSPCQTSHTSGGRSGFTPMPSTDAWMSSRMALPASEFVEAEVEASPGVIGSRGKHFTPVEPER